MNDAGERRVLLEAFSELEWRVWLFEAADDGLPGACGEPATRLVVVDGSAPEAGVVARVNASSRAPVVAVATSPSAEVVVGAVKAGAVDFVVLGGEPRELRESILRVVDLHVRVPAPRSACPIEARVVGRSRAARLMRSRLEGLASLPAPVLVLGEAGTGRDTVAHALHEASGRAEGPFRRIDCGDWRPGETLPSDGLLYLDHVDRLSPAGQQFFAHRLRQMQQAGWERGPRVVASAGPGFAGARDAGAVAEGDGAVFDAGLREELMRFPLELVPLRERLEDVSEIADQIVRRLGEGMKREVRLSPDAHAFLARQGWPGNVQQLARLLERGVGFCASGLIDAGTMEQLLDDFEESLAAIRRKREVTERDELLATLARTGGNISRCADAMGRSRGAVYRLIEKYGIALPRPMRKRPPPLRDVDAAG